MSEDWTEKYRPKSLTDVIGNPKAVGEIKEWANQWKNGVPRYRALVLMGTPGIGKTTSVEALANDYGWDIVEMNASDQRTGEAIRNVAMRASYFNSFTDKGEYLSSSEGRMKLIVLDEADSLYGNADKGAAPVIAELVKKTQQPVVLIVNDFYALKKKASSLQYDTQQITFQKPTAGSIAKALRKIVDNEGIKASDMVLKRIAENCSGDVRAAVRDLQSVGTGKQEILESDLTELSDRNKKSTMFDLMFAVFRKRDPSYALKVKQSVDEEPNLVLMWIDENMPYEFKNTGDLIRGYEKLSRADIFLGRVVRRQYYGFWSYASELMTMGVVTSRWNNPNGFEKFKVPSSFKNSKELRETKKNTCMKIGKLTHDSTKKVSSETIPTLRILMANNEKFALNIIKEYSLDEDEIAYILGVKPGSKEVVNLLNKSKSKTDEDVVEEVKEVEVKPVEKTPQPSKSQKSLFDF